MSYISDCLAKGESAVDLYVTADNYKKLHYPNNNVSWGGRNIDKDTNKIARDCIFYMEVFKDLLLYNNEELELINSLLGSNDNDNYKIAEQILRNVKLKE